LKAKADQAGILYRSRFCRLQVQTGFEIAALGFLCGMRLHITPSRQLHQNITSHSTNIFSQTAPGNNECRRPSLDQQQRNQQKHKRQIRIEGASCLPFRVLMCSNVQGTILGKPTRLFRVLTTKCGQQTISQCMQTVSAKLAPACSPRCWLRMYKIPSYLNLATSLCFGRLV